MPAGRPPLYNKPEDLQEKIDEYFNTDVEKVTMHTKDGEPYQVSLKTVTGLALHCGFCNRKSFYEYEKKPQFTHTIKMARSRIENYYEQLNQVKGGASIIFALKNVVGS